MALAADAAIYTPPAAIATFARRGDLLPLWWCNQSDVVMASPPSEEWITNVKQRYNLGGTIFKERTFNDDKNIFALEPWGWSRDAANRLRRFGKVPDDIEAIRELSHRRTSIAILQSLGYANIPRECNSVKDAVSEIERLSGNAVIKTPWSCSSRGVRKVPELTNKSLISFINASINRTGGIIVESLYSKTLDFAALFKSQNGKVIFTGWSVFKTGNHGMYVGNIVDSQCRLTELIPDKAQSLIPQLEDVLTSLIPTHYTGMLGVDMLQTTDGEICPCVELNLRRTMGHVAMDIHTHTGMRGLLNSAPQKTEPLLWVTPDLFRLDIL